MDTSTDTNAVSRQIETHQYLQIVKIQDAVQKLVNQELSAERQLALIVYIRQEISRPETDTDTISQVIQ